MKRWSFKRYHNVSVNLSCSFNVIPFSNGQCQDLAKHCGPLKSLGVFIQATSTMVQSPYINAGSLYCETVLESNEPPNIEMSFWEDDSPKLYPLKSVKPPCCHHMFPLYFVILYIILNYIILNKFIFYIIFTLQYITLHYIIHQSFRSQQDGITTTLLQTRTTFLAISSRNLRLLKQKQREVPKGLQTYNYGWSTNPPY